MTVIELRDWSMWVAEWVIVVILLAEYKYDEAKDLEKKQKRTRTTKKTTSKPTGETVVEEAVETSEPFNKGE